MRDAVQRVRLVISGGSIQISKGGMMWNQTELFCPKCGEQRLLRHEHWTDGTSSETPYCKCLVCDARFHLAVCDPECDYYRDKEGECE